MFRSGEPLVTIRRRATATGPSRTLPRHELGPGLSCSANPERKPVGAAADRRAGRARAQQRDRLAGERNARPVRVGLRAADRVDRPDDRRRSVGRPDRVRRHGERARRADGDGDVLGAIHAALVPRRRPQGDARRADGEPRLLVHADPADRRGRSEPRRDARRVPAQRRPRPVPRLPRPVPASPAPGQGCRAGGAFRTGGPSIHRGAREHAASLRCRRRARSDPRARADARGAQQDVRCAPGDRRRGPARLGDPPRRRDRDAARRRRLRLLRRQTARGARDARRSRGSPSGVSPAGWRSGSSGRSTRIRPSRCAFSSTSRSGRCLRP